MSSTRRRFLAAVAPMAAAASPRLSAASQSLQPAPAISSEYLTRAFLEGREYFVLRSGPIQLIVQADRVDIAPAFLWLAFDARDSKQSSRKGKALNFGDGTGFTRTALAVMLGGFPFTAIGHQTETRWLLLDGIPAGEAVWWAGGLRVTEHLFALADSGLFLRRITLASRDLAAPEQVMLRLLLPAGPAAFRDGWLVQESYRVRIALSHPNSVSSRPQTQSGELEIGPLTVPVGGAVSVDTWLSVSIPTDGRALETPKTVGASLSQARAAWAVASSLDTSDDTIRALYDKVRFGLAAMVAPNGVMDAGIFEYGAQWVRDTSNTIVGLLHAGHFELARAALAHMLEHMIDANGNAMIANVFVKPELEQFDQMGELVCALKAYSDWTGDDSVIRDYRARILALIERPLRPEFLHPCGMVHNRREFWERTFDDAFELAYQTYVALGLRDAVSLADALGAADRAERWKRESDAIVHAMLSDPSYALVENDRLIKRRSVKGEWVRNIVFPSAAADVPLATEQQHLAEPDATMALPIAFRLVDPHSALARNTLEELEKLWDARWTGGGYERYHSSGQSDQPGPWTFATCFILRAQHEAGLYTRSRRSLHWLNTVQGGRAGAWFEEIPIVRSQAPAAGIIPWTSAEIGLFLVRHLLGVRFDGRELALRPAPYPGSPPIRADLRFRQGRLKLELPGAGPFHSATVNGRSIRAAHDGAIHLDPAFTGGAVVFHR